MNGNIQQQHNASQQIAGVIRNFRKVPTQTGKPMAVFTVGTTPAKCFDLMVGTAEQWADTGKNVSISGHFSNHSGRELVVQSIGLVDQGQTDHRGLPEIAAANPTSVRESSPIMEDFSGCVSDIRTINTRSGMPMITLKIGSTAFKALGELATAIQNSEGKHIEISARKGSFGGVTEYAVKTLKAIDGSAVNLTDAAVIGNKPVQPALKPAIDNRPDKAAIEVTQNYIVITIPVGSTYEQIRRITSIANEALRGVGPGVFDSPSARVEAIHPKDQVQEGDIDF